MRSSQWVPLKWYWGPLTTSLNISFFIAAVFFWPFALLWMLTLPLVVGVEFYQFKARRARRLRTPHYARIHEIERELWGAEFTTGRDAPRKLPPISQGYRPTGPRLDPTKVFPRGQLASGVQPPLPLFRLPHTDIPLILPQGVSASMSFDGVVVLRILGTYRLLEADEVEVIQGRIIIHLKEHRSIDWIKR